MLQRVGGNATLTIGLTRFFTHGARVPPTRWQLEETVERVNGRFEAVMEDFHDTLIYFGFSRKKAGDEVLRKSWEKLFSSPPSVAALCSLHPLLPALLTPPLLLHAHCHAHTEPG